MNKSFKPGFLIGLILLLAGNTWALPIVGDSVKMFASNSTEHYRMTITNSSDSGTIGNVFDTFCVERNEYFNNNGVYTVGSVVEYANNGGYGGAINGQDPVSDESIWLYASYFNGVFGARGYDLGYKVQKAIWYLENEYQNTETSLSNEALAYWNDFNDKNKFSRDDTYSISGWNIKVVNLVTLNDNGDIIKYNQSQLVGNPVPEPATMFLFGIGLLGLARIGRKKRAQ